MHPSEEIIETKSKYLSNKKIVLAITGSIAAVESVKLSRELIRHGADVIPVMTHSATKIIHPDSLWFATGKKPIIELTGETEHVSYCGKIKTPVDLLLISPCTANTISKIAHGIDDSSVTTFATTAIGSKVPIIIVPAMHLSMYDHDILQKNIKKCEKIGIHFIKPEIKGNKARIADISEITDNVIRNIYKNDFKNKKILIIGGSTSEPIDDVRIITNRSSGLTAFYLAKNALYRGADVEVWMGSNTKKIPDYIKNKRYESNNDLQKMINDKKIKDFDIIIIPAAISDYIPQKQSGKIKSGKKDLKINLKETDKIIKKIRSKNKKAKIVGFKLESDEKQLKKRAIDLLEKNNLNMVVANTVSAFNNKKNKIYIFDSEKNMKKYSDRKEKLAEIILNSIKEKK